MMRTIRVAACCAVILGFGITHYAAAGQISYARGQDVSPTFDGWERNADGTIYMYFGYFNRNTEESLDVPIGADNTVDTERDRGQPTHFYPGRRWWVFRVAVPKDWPKDKRVIWTLKSRGRVNQAKAWLQPEMEVNPEIMSKNTRDSFMFAGGGEDSAVGATESDNAPPVVTGPPAQTIALSESAKITIKATDDGRPKPPAGGGRGRGRGGNNSGLRFRWILYRGTPDVKFSPDTNGPFQGSPVTAETTVTFAASGVYRIRAIASDGQAFATYDVDVTVK